MSRPTIRKNDFGHEALSLLDAIYNTAMWFNENGRDSQDLVIDTYNKAFRIRDESYSGGDCKILMFRILIRILFGDFQLDFREQLPDDFEDGFESFPSVDISEIEKIPAHVVVKVIKNLPLEIQLVIFLSNLSIFTYEEIAEIFDVYREEIRLKIYHGYMLIREDLFNYVASTNIRTPIKIERIIRRRKAINDDKIRGTQ